MSSVLMPTKSDQELAATNGSLLDVVQFQQVTQAKRQETLDRLAVLSQDLGLYD